MNQRRIFYFWEPEGSMPAYLKLCLRTWQVHLPTYDIVGLNYSNLDQYIRRGTYDMPTLRRVRLALQKDAVMVAVLRDHGGIFMDVDTLVTRDIAPITGKLVHTDLVMFGNHMAFLAARPRCYVLTRWVERISERLERLNQPTPPTPEWHYLGNSGLAEVQNEMIAETFIGKAYEAITSTRASWPSLANALWRRLPERIWARRRGLFFRTIFRKYLTSLDRRKYGFIAEGRYFGKARGNPKDEYLTFWFEDRQETGRAFLDQQRLIGLHNSWTPEWYKDLSEEQVLEHPCLLSRTIQRVLGA